MDREFFGAEKHRFDAWIAEVLKPRALEKLIRADVFRRVTKDDSYPICSWVVAHAYKAAGKSFGVKAWAANPDHIWDFVNKETDKYDKIRGLRPIPGAL